MRISKKVAKLIERERVCRVATAGNGNTPHVVPVCHVMAGDKIYFGSGSDARKVANLRENPHVALTVDLYAEDWSHLKGILVHGTATLIEKGPHKGVRFVRHVSYSRLLFHERLPDLPGDSGRAHGVDDGLSAPASWRDTSRA